MPQLRKHVFVCTNSRSPENSKGCCASKDSERLLGQLKKALRDRGIDDIRANKAGCLDCCEHGVTLVVYPEGVWYGRVTLEDIEELVESHLVGEQPVERLRIP